MAKADVTTLVSTLSTGTADATTISDYYDDFIQELGRPAFAGVLSLTGATFVQAVDGTIVYTLPAAAVRPLIICHDRTQLGEDTQETAAALDEAWRSSRYKPLSFILSDESHRTFAVAPVPDATGADPTGLTPFDSTAPPANNFTIIHTDTGPDVHYDEELPVALILLAREWGRDSDHCDREGAQIVGQIGLALLQLLHLSEVC